MPLRTSGSTFETTVQTN